MAEGQRKLMERSAVCCLSTLPDNILMWSHYADAHQGICLRFTPAAKISPKLNPELIHFELAFPVHYSEKRPEINMLDIAPDDLLQRALLTKADFWAYEQEWRMINSRFTPGNYSFPKFCFDGVVFGARVSPDTREMVMRWIEQRGQNMALFDAQFDDRLFRLNIVDRSGG